MASSSSLLYLDAVDPETGAYLVVVESPAGSRNKFKYDERLGLFLVHKILPAGAAFPFDFGFPPSTRADDGDPLDILIVMPEPAYPGCVVPARLLGVIEAEQTEKGKTLCNDRLAAVPEVKFGPAQPRHLKELRDEKLKEFEHFFVWFKREEGREFRPLGCHGPKRAEKLVEEGRQRFRSKA
jgi:inorganic pyrophosphatase